MERRDHHGSGVRHFVKRFPPAKIYGEGLDPNGAYREFIKKDVVKNIDVHQGRVQRLDDLESRKGKPALGCTKSQNKARCTRLKVDYELKTDHITFQPSTSKSQEQLSFKRYSKAKLHESVWLAPRAASSFSNCHSTAYNIINHEPSPVPNVRASLPKFAGRCKGISEFSDINRPFKANFCPQFKAVLAEDAKVFYKRTGIFSYMYDAAARHGNMIMPFEKSVKKVIKSKT